MIISIAIVDIPSVPGVFTISGIPAIGCVPAVVSGPAVKGSLTRDFRVQGFFINQFPPGP